MALHLTQVLESFTKATGTSLHREGEACVLELSRHGIVVKVTVPDEVLEWFVDVEEGDVHDWWDYTGYDDTPADQLAEEMTADIAIFVGWLLTRKLRIRRKSGSNVLEWLNEEEWNQAIPFTDEISRAR